MIFKLSPKKIVTRSLGSPLQSFKSLPTSVLLQDCLSVCLYVWYSMSDISCRRPSKIRTQIGGQQQFNILYLDSRRQRKKKTLKSEDTAVLHTITGADGVMEHEMIVFRQFINGHTQIGGDIIGYSIVSVWLCGYGDVTRDETIEAKS